MCVVLVAMLWPKKYLFVRLSMVAWSRGRLATNLIGREGAPHAPLVGVHIVMGWAKFSLLLPSAPYSSSNS
jgi:hypothetical protein